MSAPHSTPHAPARFWSLVPWLLPLGTFVLYALTQSKALLPGTPARILNSVLGLDPVPTVAHRLYLTLAGAVVRLPLDPIVTLNLFSALFAALSVLLVFLLMSLIPLPRSPRGDRSEHLLQTAQKVVGLASALFLAVAVPFWLAATRADSLTFDLALLLTCFWLLFRYLRDTGGTKHLLGAAFLYGLAITEYASMIALAPLFAFALAVILLRKGALTPRTLVQLFLAGVIGLLFYGASPMALAHLPDHGYGQFASSTDAVLNVWKQQYYQLRSNLTHGGALLVFLAAFAPWIYVLFMGRPRPSRARLVEFAVALSLMLLTVLGVALLLEIRLSPFRIHGQRLLLLPYLSIATWMGYLVGYWYIAAGVLRHQKESNMLHRFSANTFSTVCMALPLAIGFMTLREHVAVPPPAATTFSKNLVASLDDEKFLVTAIPYLDDLLRYMTHASHEQTEVVSVGQLSQEAYRNYLTAKYLDGQSVAASDASRAPLALLDALLGSRPNGVQSAAFMTPQTVLALGFQFLPHGLLVRAADDFESTDPETLYQTNRALFDGPYRAQTDALVNKKSPTRLDTFLLQAYSRAANNLGTSLRLLKQDALARQAYDLALKLLPENPSTLLNLHELYLAEARALPSDSEQAKQITAQAEEALDHASRVAQGGGYAYQSPLHMASAYGYIYSEEMYLWLARHYRAAGLQALEATAVQQASIISPTSPRVRTTRAGLDLMRGDTKGAAAEFRRILDQNPSDTTARMGLAALYHEAGDPTAALAMLEDPAAAADDVHIVSLRALVNLEAGHAVRARELFERARTLAGQDAQSLTLMALTAYGLSEFGLAKDYAERALPMNPRYLPLLQLLARVAEGEGNYARAVELMENMVDINPETITTRESLLALHMRQSEFDAGKEVANALLEIDPENFSANMALSDIASAAGRLADQEKYLREAIRNDEHPLYAYALNNLAYCLILQGRPEEAVPFASKAVEVNPGFDKAHHTLARAYKDLDRLDEARQEITKAITLAPADTNHDVLRAEIAYAAGQKDEARELITRVLPQLTGEWRVRGQQLLDDVR